MADYDDAFGLALWDDRGTFQSTRAKREAKDIPSLMRGVVWPNDPYDPPPLPEYLHGPVAFDFETEDPQLNIRGPSWAFPGVGKILGLAIAWGDTHGQYSAYYALDHETNNYKYPAAVKNWFCHHWHDPNIIWVGANTQYDIGWAYRDITHKYSRGACIDVAHMSALLWEYHFSYSLEAIGQRELGEGKEVSVIKRLIEECGLTKSEVMQHFKYIPGNVAAPYGATDALRTLQCYYKMLPRIEQENLRPVFELESGLLPMCTEMRRKGVRVDIGKAEALKIACDEEALETKAAIKKECGVSVEPWEGETYKRALRTISIEVGDTLDANFLKQHAKEPLVGKLLRLRKLDKMSGTFLAGHFLGHHWEGRLHPTFNQLRGESEEGGIGTVTGRFSITGPGLQQLPIRDPEWGEKIRGLVLPDDGFECVASPDFSSQEPRLAIHAAAQWSRYKLAHNQPGIDGAEEAVRRYIADPYLDIHQMVADLCSIDRDRAKTIWLGRTYGMGGGKLARSLGLSTVWQVPDDQWKSVEFKALVKKGKNKWVTEDGLPAVECAGPEARELMKKIDNRAPFLKELFNATEKQASENGYITTLLKRRCRFMLKSKKEGSGYNATHKALNRYCQSSAADQTKKAMLDLWELGIVPMLTIHDELLISVNSQAEADHVADVMASAVKLLVPSVVDAALGWNWSEAKANAKLKAKEQAKEKARVLVS